MGKNVIFILLIASIGSSSLAQQVPAQLKTLAEDYALERERIAESEVERRKVLATLYQLTERMKKISKKKGELTNEMLGAKANVRNLARKAAELERTIDGQRVQLKSRLRTIYKLSGEGALRIVFSSGSLQEFDRNLRYLKIITDRDYDLMKSYEENMNKFAKQKIQLRKQVERLARFEKQVKAQENLLVSEQREKGKILSELEQSRTAALRKMKDIREKTVNQGLAAAAQRDEQLIEILSSTFFENRGQLPAPTAGPIIREFGYLQDEKFKFRLGHKGLTFRAPYGSDVRSIYSGRVAFVGSRPGYGKVVIVDHGDHYYSLYAHASNVTVSAGEKVKKGSVIAKSGRNMRDGDALYFEIRHFSEPENPEPWLYRSSIAKNMEESPS